MADLGIFAVLVGLFALVGIALGILAARRMGAWDERRATAERPATAERRATADAGAVAVAGGTGAVTAILERRATASAGTAPAAGEPGTVTAAGETGWMFDSEPLEIGGDTVD